MARSRRTVRRAVVLDHEPGQEATYATEAVEHDVGGGRLLAGVDDRVELFAEELLPRCLRGLMEPVELGDVDRCGTERQSGQGLQDSEGLVSREHVAVDVPGEPVELEDLLGGLVDQASAVDRWR